MTTAMKQAIGIFVASLLVGCSVAEREQQQHTKTPDKETNISAGSPDSAAKLPAKRVIAALTASLEGQKYSYSARMYVESLVRHQAGRDSVVSPAEANRIKLAIKDSGALTASQKAKCQEIIESLFN